MEKQILFLIANSLGDAAINLSRSLWEKYCPECEVVITRADNYRTAMLNYIADETTPSQAAFVPALTVPVSSVSFSDLEVLKSFILNEERKKELTRVKTVAKSVAQVRHYIPQELPNVYDKEKLATMIANLKIADKEVNISTAYAAVVKSDTIPFDASVVNSSITGLVARANPNMKIVASYIVERKFIITNSDGFAAITAELEKLLDQ